MVRHVIHAALTAAVVVSVAGYCVVQAAAEVPQTVGPAVIPTSDLPPLKLSDAQRAKIEAVLAGQNTQVSFDLKSAKGAQSFEPSVGATIPKGLKGHAFPPPLIYEMPLLKRYTYIKFKDQALIVNPMTKKIVEMLPQT